MKVRCAVFPVAGLGTRFLPATKAVPKELLPVVDKPLIQYATEEALRAGIRELVFVVSPGKEAIRDHFGRARELESALRKKGKDDLLDLVRSILPKGARCRYVVQEKPLGLGHAVLCAHACLGRSPFAVVLPDDLIEDGNRGCLAQMVKVFDRHKASVVAVETVPREHTNRYGIVSAGAFDGRVGRMKAIVEKPAPAVAPSNLAVVGRYLFTHAILECLARTTSGAGGEIQLTDAISQLLDRESVVAYRFDGRRYDCGSKLGMVRATIDYALRDREVGKQVAAHLTGTKNRPGRRN